MSEAKHTPGPWEVVEDDYTHFNGYLDENHVQGYNIVAANGRTVVGAEGISVEGEDIANACLIAAAPEMLQMLRYCHEWLQGTEAHRARAVGEVIAKATGA